MSEWISVEDRLPEDGVFVLVYYSKSMTDKEYPRIWTENAFRYCLAQHFSEIENAWYEEINGEPSYIIDPSHWMPLPQPPKDNE